MAARGVLNSIVETIQDEWSKPAPAWSTVRHGLTASERAFLEKECRTASAFDPRSVRSTLWDAYCNQSAHGILRQCRYGHVFLVSLDPRANDSFPWELWGRIFRLYGTLNARHPIRVYLFADSVRRQFPDDPRQPIGPEHINGGYTYPCKADTILIYRAEDATRVLIHELQHAFCLDDPKKGVDQMEADRKSVV